MTLFLTLTVGEAKPGRGDPVEIQPSTAALDPRSSRQAWASQDQGTAPGRRYVGFMVSTNALGEYLRSCRELIRPHDVGLPTGGRRKVAGLRREELAMLAGVSSDYYLRLEQGRDQHPSAQVLDALARVLQLDADSRGHRQPAARHL
jgi:DNA-binding XRE family transcriptional regulator